METDISEVTRQLIERDQRGRKKYGTSLDREDLTHDEWLQHLAEELMDAAGYALAAKRPNWQPIETAPKDGTRILAVIRWTYSDGTEGEVQDVIYWYEGAGFWVCGTPMNYVQVLDAGINPTHWKPLGAFPPSNA